MKEFIKYELVVILIAFVFVLMYSMLPKTIISATPGSLMSNGHGEGTIEAIIDASIKPSQKIRLGDSIRIVLTSWIKEARFRSNEAGLFKVGATAIKPPEKLTKEELFEAVCKNTRIEDISCELSFAGAKVEPSGKKSFNNDGCMQWSVKPESAGTIRGHVTFYYPHDYCDKPGEYRIELHGPNFLELDLTCAEPLFDKEKIMVLCYIVIAGTGFITAYYTYRMYYAKIC